MPPGLFIFFMDKTFYETHRLVALLINKCIRLALWTWPSSLNILFIPAGNNVLLCYIYLSYTLFTFYILASALFLEKCLQLLSVSSYLLLVIIIPKVEDLVCMLHWKRAWNHNNTWGLHHILLFIMCITCWYTIETSFGYILTSTQILCPVAGFLYHCEIHFSTHLFSIYHA